MHSQSSAANASLTLLALLAFAANSLFCRLGLHAGAIDAASFTSIRLLSGALMLTLLLLLRQRRRQAPLHLPLRPLAALSLFAYAILFSFAYLELDTGIGALILFGCVQLTMIGHGLVRGNRPAAIEWLGILLAAGGLVLLLLPGASAPSPFAACAMALAGAAWGLYSLLGRGNSDALAGTAANFMLALPLGLAVSLAGVTEPALETRGVLFAVASGALASGCGYALWYQVLPRLTPTTAATVQLTVPALAALGGVLLLAEPLSLRLVLSGTLTLGGIALVIRAGARGAR
ncbi:EamA family transporter [Marinobacterium aestuariivivens]|uniref:EamA family transporter n=1 Tax=Marinobacterium aestuariivivens TaxID=1698799 RepID=A0ABW2A4R6_9GAMM